VSGIPGHINYSI